MGATLVNNSDKCCCQTVFLSCEPQHHCEAQPKQSPLPRRERIKVRVERTEQFGFPKNLQNF
jgi:hypothetical protein